MAASPFLALALLAVPTSAVTPGSMAQEPGRSSAPSLVLEALDGTLQRLPAKGLALRDPRERGAWIVRPEGFAPPASTEPGARAEAGEPVEVELASGDVLLGHIVGGEGERLRVRLTGGIELPLDLARIHVLRLPNQLTGHTGALESPEEGDRLYRRPRGRSGVLDPTDGTFESFTADGLRFESHALGLKHHPWSEVAGLTLEILDELGDDEGDADDVRRLPVVLELVDGGRLRATLRTLTEVGCELRVAGIDTAFEWGSVHELVVDDGRLAFLSDLPAASEVGRGSPFLDDAPAGDEPLGMVWEHRADRNVLGGPLVTARHTWRRGIGMHAPTRVTWALDGTWTTLRARVGIDDSTARHPPGARGSVVFRVLLDGRSAWESPVVHSEEPALALPPLDLEGVRELTLEADMAEDFRGDRANWLRPILTR